ncbi:serine/threonine-protein kinase WNK4-like [Panicum miliaceum]|uniref:Serine/threonine-protein kinase WNK4-like n=1 Tax=Panicum miliaceum TaxID=4540 RepID=A0A3L6PHL1_PANMI|nr:serine/threonine-protein kinase WNK4-like [Panicum miliaceum]
MQRRAEFSFPGSPARGLPPRAPPPGNAMAPRYGEEEVRWLQASRQASPDYSSGGGSGTPSPQLWAYQPDLHRPYPASAGSSPSRAQAIAGYRREMLDLVRGLPESAYELSLRDIVEHPASSSPPPPPEPLPQPPNASAASAQASDEPAGTTKDAAAADAQVQDGKKQSGSSKKQGRKQRTMRKQRSRSLERSVSLDTGLLIKLFLPLSIGGKKKVSPRPDAAKDGKKKDKEKKKQGKKKKKQQPEAPVPAQEEWWTKSEFSEAGGSSRTSSTGSSSNSSTGSIRNGHANGSVNPRAPARSWSRKRTGCYAFFRANKSKNGVGQD